MKKTFTNKEEFMLAISGIAKDGSFALSLKDGTKSVDKGKQYPYVEEAENMDLQMGIDNLPTALRFDLIKEGYEDLVLDLKFDELDGPDDYWPGKMTSYIMRKFPEYESKLNWGKLKNTWLVHVILEQPQFIDKVDFSKNKNLMVAAVTIILGTGDFALQFGDFNLGGIGTATFAALFLNWIFSFADQSE